MKNNIKEYRDKGNISQGKLAELCNVSRQTINAIENNKYDPSLQLAFDIAEVLGVRVDELFVNRIEHKKSAGVMNELKKVKEFVLNFKGDKGMSKNENLYRIETTERCYCSLSSLVRPMPSFDSVEKNGSFASIPAGTKGWIVEKFGSKYFRPDKNQEGLDLYTVDTDKPTLITYKSVEGHYRIISEDE